MRTRRGCRRGAPALLVAVVALLALGCAGAGPRYRDFWPGVTPTAEAYGRIVLFRTRDSSLYILRAARLRVDDVEGGSLQIGEFRYYNLTAGEHSIRTDLWDAVGSCHVNFALKAGQTLFFQVDPRKASFWSFAGPALATELLTDSFSFGLAAGLASNAAESYGKACGGAFLLYPVDGESARPRLLDLRLAQGG